MKIVSKNGKIPGAIDDAPVHPSLGASIRKAMLLATLVSGIILAGWMVARALLVGHFIGTGWTESAARGFQHELARFRESTERLADLAARPQGLASGDLQEGELLARLAGESFQVLGDRLRQAPSGALRSRLLKARNSGGFISDGRSLYYSAIRQLSSARGKEQLVLLRGMDTFINALSNPTKVEVLVIAGGNASVSTFRDTGGQSALPDLGPDLRRDLADIKAGEIRTGLTGFKMRPYQGMHSSDGKWYDVGSRSLKAYYAMFPIRGFDGAMLGAVAAIAPKSVTLVGLKMDLFASVILLLILCAGAAYYARRTTLRYVSPLTVEISRVRCLCRRFNAEPVSEDASSNELEVLRAAVSQVEKAIEHDRQTALQFETERARASYAAKMAGLGEMAAGMAHEINTPLAAISARAGQASELLAEDPLDREILQGLCKGISATAERIAKIVKALRSFARNGGEEAAHETGLAALLEEVLSLCSERFRVHGVRLEIEEVPAFMAIFCRSTEVIQVLINLLNNAFDAVQGLPEKWVRVSFARGAGKFRILVTDSGPGISSAVAQKIFQPFYTSKGPGRGTGLGLSISKGIAESHGGSLEVDPDAGNTRFVLSLPVQAHSKEEPSHAVRTEVPA